MEIAASQIGNLRFPAHGWVARDSWTKLAGFLIVGYLGASRAFAYLGFPWISLYIGEMALVAFLLFGPTTNRGSWIKLVRRIKRLRRFQWALALLLCYGGFEALRGTLQGYPLFTACRDTAFNYYPLFIFLGVWVGLKDRNFLRGLVRALAWCNGCYGLAYVLLLNRLPWAMPGTASAASRVPLFTEPYGSAVALLGLVAFEPKLRRVWYLIALNAFVMLAVQVRAEWVGFAVGLLVFAWCTKRLRQVFAAGLLVIALLGAMYVTHISLPSPEGRGGRISADYIAARAVAPVSKNAASNLAPEKAAGFFAGTAEWRLIWWAGIWSAVNGTISKTLFGFGYGYPIGDLNPLIESGTFIQTPHSDFFYALGYSGWIGVLLFLFLQIELLRLLWRGYGITAQPFGLMCWAALLTTSLFEDFFEAPFGAIPFYLLIGITLAPGLIAASGGSGRAAAPVISPAQEVR